MTLPHSSHLRLRHLLPNRLRVELVGWSGAAPEAVERSVDALPGVQRVHAHPRTRNVLIHFDPAVTSAAELLLALGPEPAPDPATPEGIIAAYRSAWPFPKAGSPEVAAAVAVGLLELGAFVLRHGRLLAALLQQRREPAALVKLAAGLTELSGFRLPLQKQLANWSPLLTHLLELGLQLLARHPLGVSLALLEIFLWCLAPGTRATG